MWGVFHRLQWQEQGSLVGSTMAHGLLLVAVIWFSVPRPLPTPPSGAIFVEFVAQSQAPIEPAPQAKVLSAPVPQTEQVVAATEVATSQPASPAQTEAGGTVVATRFYAASVLNDPANSEVRKNFPLLADQEQVIQICNIEALEQLREAEPGTPPDTLVGYAFDSIDVSGLDLSANGGAVRSGGQWYRIRYRCAVAPDMRGVVAFEYELGELVPESEWEAHFLNGNDE